MDPRKRVDATRRVHVHVPRQQLSCGEWSIFKLQQQPDRRDVTTLVMDMSDAFQNPSRTNGLSFFYTGSTAANDKLTIYGKATLSSQS